MAEPAVDGRSPDLVVLQVVATTVRLTLFVATVALIALASAAVAIESLTDLELGAVPISLIAASFALCSPVVGCIEAPFARRILARVERDSR